MKNIIKTYFLIICGVLLCSFQALAGPEIKGKVTDTHGIALPGVIVSEQGSTDKAMTDLEGAFSIEVEKIPTTLSFYLNGYQVTNADVKSETSEFTIALAKEEFEYVAYGTQSKDNVTASIFSISGDELVTSRSANLFTALQGRLPGLQIIQTDGEPGKESFNVLVRGSDSRNSNGVMYIVDGVERNPNGIETYEVERVTVLKDAAATSIYGMRGAGGVLIITTKKGFEGKSKITLSVDHSMQTPTMRPNFVNAFDYANMFNQRLANDTLYSDAQDIYSGGTGLDHSGVAFYTPEELEHYRLGDLTDFYPVRDMQKEFLKDYSKLTRVNVNFRGGSKAMRYFTSIGYTNQGGLLKNEPFDKYSYDAEQGSKRFNFRTNLDITLNPNLNLYVNIGGSMQQDNSPNGMTINELIEKLYKTPNNAINDLTPEGEIIVKRDKLSFETNKSIYGELNRTGSNFATDTRLNNTFGVRQKLDKLVPGLSASAELAFDVHSTSTQQRKRSYAGYEVSTLTDVNGVDSLGYVQVPGTSNSTLSDGQGKFFYYMYNMRGSLNYNRTFGNKHEVSGMLMAQRYMQQQQVLLATNYLGLAGRGTYAYDNRYFAEVNFSYQGSEQFAKGKRFGLFPSLSAGWIVSNEKFMDEYNALSFLKLRASVGQVGNSVYGYGSNNQYLYLTTWNSNSTENQLGNENIQWETYTKYNVGIEAECFNSLSVGFDYFYHDNKDIIIRDIAIIPDGMMGLGGASLPPANLGTSINQGYELVLGYNKKVNNDLSVSLNGNLSYTRNEQKYTAELPYDETYAYPYRQQGYPVGYQFGYRSAGLFNSQAEVDEWYDQTYFGGVPTPGDIKYVDLTNDGVVDEKDQAPLGVGQFPQMTFGLNLQVNYKGFDVSALLTGATKRNVYLSGFGRFSNQDNFTEYMKEAWTQEKFEAGDKIEYPRLGSESTNFIKSDYWMADGTFLRLRNVELGYTLPEFISRQIKASSIRIYANGLNLLTWDKLPNSDFDPESANGSNTNYPILKAYNFGISVKF